MRILAACTANIARSILFEEVFSKIPEVEVKSCGMYPAKRFNEKALDFYNKENIVLSKESPEGFQKYQYTDPFDIVIFLSNKAVELPRVGFGNALFIQATFPDPLSDVVSFETLYNRYKIIANKIDRPWIDDPFAFVFNFIEQVRNTEDG